MYEYIPIGALWSLAKGIISSQLSDGEKLRTTHQLEKRVSNDGDLCKETKAYILITEQLRIEHSWERPNG